MVLVLMCIFAQAAMAQQADYNKLSGRLITLMDNNEHARTHIHRASSTTEAPLIMALVRADSEEALTNQGVKVFDHMGDIYFTAMPISSVAPLSLDYRVARIEVGNDVYSKMDRTPGYVSAEFVWSGNNYITPLPQAYKGKNVLVGICDSSFDFLHPMFRNADGTSRIKWAWDSYTGRGTTEGYQGIGSLYTTSERILQARGSIDSVDFHGTHVAAIAAGSSIVSKKTAGLTYSGIAPEADIALFMSGQKLNAYDPTDLNPDPNNRRTLKDNVTNDLKKSFDAGNTAVTEFYNKTTIANIIALLGVKHFFDYATQQGKPAVANCSFGNIPGFFDDELFQEVYQKLVEVPGHIIVASSGNEGDEDVYRHKAANETLNDSIIATERSNTIEFSTTNDDFTIRLKYSDEAHTEISFSPADLKSATSNMKVVNITYDGHQLPFGFNWAKKKAGPNGTTLWQLDLLFPDAYDAEDPDDVFSIKPDERKSAVSFSGAAEMTIVCTYNENNFKGRKAMVNAPHTANFPGNYPDVISVGAVNHRATFINNEGKETSSGQDLNPGNIIVSWSSCGPTLDGRVKPDVCAPGFNIISAFNSNIMRDAFISKAIVLANNMVESWTENGERVNMIASSGSSMAAPVVTGVIALWLQADPTLTPARIKEVFATTCLPISKSITYPNNTYGYGEIDAYAGLLKILKLDTSIPGLSRQQVRVTLDGRTLHVEGCDNAQVAIYSLNGQQVFTAQAVGGNVLLPALVSGVYAVKVESLGSTLIRL